MSNSHDGWDQQQSGAWGQSPDPAGRPEPRYGAYAPAGQDGAGQGDPFAVPNAPGQAPGNQYGQQGYGQEAGAPYGQSPAEGANPFAAPQQYGGYGQPMFGGGAPRRPGVLTAACVIVWVIGGFAVLAGLAMLAVGPEIQHELHSAGLAVNADVVRGIGVGFLIAAALYILGAVLAFRGGQGGRVLLTVLFGLSLLGQISNMAQGASGGSSVIGLAIIVMCLVFLWLKPTSDYVAAVRAAKQSGMR
jgi:hypothetical protein